MNYRLISLFHSLLDDLITGCRYKNAHKRADEVEKAVGQVGECRDTQYRSLRHAAGVPRDEHGGDSRRIFDGAA